MKKLMILGILIMVCALGAQTVRIYYSLGVSSLPDTCKISLKQGPSSVWDSLGTSPCSVVLYRDVLITEFMKIKPVWGNPAVFYSRRYSPDRTWNSEHELFGQLRQDFGDDLIRDLGSLSLGSIKAEKPDHTEAVKALTLNANISSFSFDPLTAASHPNRINLGPRRLIDDGTLFLVSHGTLALNSEPRNAAVYCNDEYVGQTPCSVKVTWFTPESKLELRFEKPGYETGMWSAAAGEKQVTVSLKPSGGKAQK